MWKDGCNLVGVLLQHTLPWPSILGWTTDKFSLWAMVHPVEGQWYSPMIGEVVIQQHAVD